ncbi:M20 aminoacylase family protein [Segnochrobactraceae bacterium EtOH-i3]
MPVLNRIAVQAPEIAHWRHDLHAHPELQFEVHRTAGFVADQLRAFGCDAVVEGIGRTGVVGVIRGQSTASGRVVGLRADMDALPVLEATGKPHASKTPGLMHACGHDGHTAMLLGAARHLADTRAFDGTAIVIFQPAEEGGGGGREMVADGLMERFGIQEVYGLHNMPGMPLGTFAIRPGAIMASADRVEIRIEGRGGHAAWPQDCVDPVLVGSAIVLAAQTIVSRAVAPLESAVVSLTMFHAGDTDNVIPQTATLGGTVRTLSPAVRDLVEARLRHIVETTAALYGARATLIYSREYPVTVNDPGCAGFAAEVAAEIVGPERSAGDTEPRLAAEDFSFMLEARPGAYILLGNGPSASLHHPAYDFDDGLIPIGTSFWVRLAERAMPLGDPR